MTLEQQVTSLEISKRLKELGVKQKSTHWWGGIGNMGIWCDHVKQDMPKQETRFTWISAFTVSELGEMLPSDIVSGRTPDSIARGWDNWECLDFIEFGAAAYHHDDSKIKKPKFIADTEANARGKMLIYLLENKLITTS